MDINYIGELTMNPRKSVINKDNGDCELILTEQIDDHSLTDYLRRTEEQLIRVKSLLDERKLLKAVG